jgi:hypothetical protein
MDDRAEIYRYRDREEGRSSNPTRFAYGAVIFVSGGNKRRRFSKIGPDDE